MQCDNSKKKPSNQTLPKLGRIVVVEPELYILDNDLAVPVGIGIDENDVVVGTTFLRGCNVHRNGSAGNKNQKGKGTQQKEREREREDR